ncbi:MAG: hypothetical protein COB02_08470 [Candidatus Cloacimonadota bacterium]|nr:MAG: hypothetical protein COB02_08470 [Candidatus Cloacimonadota bacterium]
MQRAQFKIIQNDLKNKMVFLVGPRQVGKTCLSKEIMKSFEKVQYLNYDYYEDKEIIEKHEWPKDLDLIIFDEIHKMKNWKNFLKGVFDTSKMNILVTGSARLEVFRHAGDSLAGRYFLHHLLPFSLKELINESFTLDDLLEKGGFPEPLLSSNFTAKRWKKQYIDTAIRQDALDFKNILDFKSLINVFEILRRRVGSGISYSNIAKDIGISSNTVKSYVEVLENLFIIFLVRPYSKKISRSILKEPKVYFYDISLVEEGDVKGAKLENLVALSLYKSSLARNDSEGEDFSLHYLRTKDKKEVDFLVANNQKIDYLAEVKTSDRNFSKPLLSFSSQLNVQGFQLVKGLRQPKELDLVKVIDLEEFLKNLMW